MKKHTNLWVKSICGSLLLCLPLISLAATAEPLANVKQTSEKKTCVPETPSSSGANPGDSPSQPSPSSTTNPVEGPPVNITLVNLTNSRICYQALKYTGTRNLFGQSQITLEKLPTPVTVTFYRVDGGLLQVNLNRESQGMVVIFSATTDLGADRQALTVDQTGKVSLN